MNRRMAERPFCSLHQEALSEWAGLLFGDLLFYWTFPAKSPAVFRKGTWGNTIWPICLLYYRGKLGVDPADVMCVPRMLKPPCCVELVMCIPSSSQNLCSGIMGGKWHNPTVNVTQGKQQWADCRWIYLCLMFGALMLEVIAMLRLKLASDEWWKKTFF